MVVELNCCGFKNKAICLPAGAYNCLDSKETKGTLGQDCEQLCQEADDLMDKSKILEDQHDFEGALILIQAACAKSRAAMDAPYSNPANITLARMKHNSCVVGLRSLQRKMNGEKGNNIGCTQNS